MRPSRPVVVVSLLFASLAGGWAQTNLPPLDRLGFADGLYARGMYDLAVHEYLGVIRDPPPGAAVDVAVFRAAECYRHLGRRELAERFYRRLVTDYPDSPYRLRAQARRAELYVAAGQHADAAQILQELLRENPPADLAASARYFLGYALNQLGQANEAGREWIAVRELYPETPFAAYAAAAWAELGRREGWPADEIRKAYRFAAEKGPTPRSRAEALFQLADFAYQAGDYEESARAYEELARLYPDDARAAEARLQWAWASLQQGQYQRVLQLAEEQLARADALEDWFYLRANALRHLKREPEALAAYEQLIGKFPNGRRRSAALYEKALLLFRAQRHEEALRALAAIPDDDPTAAEERLWLAAESYAALGRKADALATWRKLVEEFPEGPRAPAALFRQAQLHERDGNRGTAAELALTLARNYPQSELAGDALLLAGYSLLKLDKLSEALSAWSELVQKHAQYARLDEVLHQMALLRLRLGQPDEAQKDLESLLERYPQSSLAAEALAGLAALDEERNDLESALQRWQAAAERAPDEKRRGQWQYRLAVVLHKLGRTDEAANMLRAVLRRKPMPDVSPSLLTWLIEHQLNCEQPAEALRAAKVLVEKADSPAWQQVASYWLGRALEANGDIASAISAYEKSASADAQTLEGLESLARLAELKLASGDARGAESAYEDLANRAAAPEALSLRTRAYFGLGRAAEAQQRWEDAARFYMGLSVLFDDPDLTPKALTRAAAMFEKLNRAEDRQKALEELRARYPNYEETTQQVAE